MITYMRNGIVMALTAGTLMLQVPAHADLFDGMSPVSTQALDHVRGGFSMEFDLGQLMLALDVNQVSMINGVVVPAQQAGVGSSGGISALVQQGSNNSVNALVLNNIPAGSLSTIIQNSLNNQMISSISTLDITITSRALAQTMALQSLTQNTLLRFLH